MSPFGCSDWKSHLDQQKSPLGVDLPPSAPGFQKRTPTHPPGLPLNCGPKQTAKAFRRSSAPNRRPPSRGDGPGPGRHGGCVVHRSRRRETLEEKEKPLELIGVSWGLPVGLPIGFHTPMAGTRNPQPSAVAVHRHQSWISHVPTARWITSKNGSMLQAPRAQCSVNA